MLAFISGLFFIPLQASIQTDDHKKNLKMFSVCHSVPVVHYIKINYLCISSMSSWNSTFPICFYITKSITDCFDNIRFLGLCIWYCEIFPYIDREKLHSRGGHLPSPTDNPISPTTSTLSLSLSFQSGFIFVGAQILIITSYLCICMYIHIIINIITLAFSLQLQNNIISLLWESLLLSRQHVQTILTAIIHFLQVTV